MQPASSRVATAHSAQRQVSVNSTTSTKRHVQPTETVVSAKPASCANKKDAAQRHKKPEPSRCVSQVHIKIVNRARCANRKENAPDKVNVVLGGATKIAKRAKVVANKANVALDATQMANPHVSC